MTKWYIHKAPLSDNLVAVCRLDDNTVISGLVDSMPEYLAWLAEGNTPEEWNPNDNQ